MAGFRTLAELSARIARRRGLSVETSEKAECKGLLVDVAELWELYVLAVLRKAWPGEVITNATRERAVDHALLINTTGRTLGLLKPDAILWNGKSVKFVADAKYKRLHASAFWPSPQREDMYQLTSYLGRFGGTGPEIIGALIYPSDPARPEVPIVEAGNPWRLADGKSILFLTLPHQVEYAAEKLRHALPEIRATIH
jgi:5-methylcytosine-specific restriction enzyme subunit McrC